ncbi:MAG TPA: PLD nuclease N-terminal domain-containing protein [Bacteroidales bacterium]|nr:PLD nuclease N-terminal domain-containing protein [Bacteroidales bacterium]
MILLGMFGPSEVIVLLFLVILVFLFPLIMLINVLQSEFEGNDKIMWVLLIIFLPFIGALLYYLMGRDRRIK